MRNFLTDHKTQIRLIFLIILFLIVFILADMRLGWGWGWTGLLPYSTITTTTTNQGKTIATEFHQSKNLWDVFDLFIIPVALAIGAFLLNKSQRKQEQQIASDQQQEMLLQKYLDAMTELILEKHLRQTIEENDKDIDLRNVARSRTLTVLRALEVCNSDGRNRRRASLLRFLYETQLISGNKPVINLKKANLEWAYMRIYNLRCVNLNGTTLYKADLQNADLVGANLEDAYIVKTILKGADLTDADLKNADLTEANLEKAILVRSDLHGANLTRANLDKANLDGAVFGYYKEKDTKWPVNFDPIQAGAIRDDNLQ